MGRPPCGSDRRTAANWHPGPCLGKTLDQRLDGFRTVRWGYRRQPLGPEDSHSTLAMMIA